MSGAKTYRETMDDYLALCCEQSAGSFHVDHMVDRCEAHEAVTYDFIKSALEQFYRAGSLAKDVENELERAFESYKTRAFRMHEEYTKLYPRFSELEADYVEFGEHLKEKRLNRFRMLAEDRAVQKQRQLEESVIAPLRTELFSEFANAQALYSRAVALYELIGSQNVQPPSEYEDLQAKLAFCAQLEGPDFDAVRADAIPSSITCSGILGKLRDVGLEAEVVILVAHLNALDFMLKQQLPSDDHLASHLVQLKKLNQDLSDSVAVCTEKQAAHKQVLYASSSKLQDMVRFYNELSPEAHAAVDVAIKNDVYQKLRAKLEEYSVKSMQEKLGSDVFNILEGEQHTKQVVVKDLGADDYLTSFQPLLLRLDSEHALLLRLMGEYKTAFLRCRNARSYSANELQESLDVLSRIIPDLQSAVSEFAAADLKTQIEAVIVVAKSLNQVPSAPRPATPPPPPLLTAVSPSQIPVFQPRRQVDLAEEERQRLNVAMTKVEGSFSEKADILSPPGASFDQYDYLSCLADVIAGIPGCEQPKLLRDARGSLAGTTHLEDLEAISKRSVVKALATLRKAFSEAEVLFESEATVSASELQTMTQRLQAAELQFESEFEDYVADPEDSGSFADQDLGLILSVQALVYPQDGSPDSDASNILPLETGVVSANGAGAGGTDVVDPLEALQKRYGDEGWAEMRVSYPDFLQANDVLLDPQPPRADSRDSFTEKERADAAEVGLDPASYVSMMAGDRDAGAGVSSAQRPVARRANPLGGMPNYGSTGSAPVVGLSPEVLGVMLTEEIRLFDLSSGGGDLPTDDRRSPTPFADFVGGDDSDSDARTDPGDVPPTGFKPFS